MKRLIALVLLSLFALPMVGLAEEPFLFRGRYTWGMSVDQIKELAAEEGLVLQSNDPDFLSYQNVPVAGIFAEKLNFHIFDRGLERMRYYITSDPQAALAWCPGILEQLVLLYGDYDEAASQQYMADYHCSNTFVWKLPTVMIALIGQSPDNTCILAYFREDPPLTPPPTPSPTPTPVTFTGDGL